MLSDDSIQAYLGRFWKALYIEAASSIPFYGISNENVSKDSNLFYFYGKCKLVNTFVQYVSAF